MVATTNDRRRQPEERPDRYIDSREDEFYNNLPTSWVIPGIATRDGELKINPVSEFLVPHNRYDKIFEFPEDVSIEGEGHESEVDGDVELLAVLDATEAKFVLAWARLGTAEAAVRELAISLPEDGSLKEYIAGIADKMEPILRERRLNL